jgi:hypothetical protein
MGLLIWDSTTLKVSYNGIPLRLGRKIPVGIELFKTSVLSVYYILLVHGLANQVTTQSYY